MNKQEVLEELETTSTQFFHVATSTGVEANNKTLSTGVFAGLGIAKSVLTKLEEPQKVIAQLSEKWHEDIGPVLWWDFPVEEPPYCGTPLDDDFPKYKTHFTELYIPDEVEEEPKFVVKQKDGFYIEGLAKIEGKTYAKTFDSEAEAYKWAELCSGMIEKV
ncbi:hypothetical protein [Enterococcus avium]|uniref:hypothetical protein n=1 Tax=Enterococcus avium TaxID=33945 RepID=UPI00232CE199|nr:hypothetical protein [Enterococcus avium]MDB1728758.1 hypothetical protein [Enterococcus avium]MDB1732847.1 hypothetical protein [Enterococcus avium]